MANTTPEIGRWYQDNTDLQLFEVVAIDEVSATVDIQYVDGELAEFDLDNWAELSLSPAEPPEDADAPFEQNFGGADEWDGDGVFHPNDFSGPVNSIEADLFTGYDDI